MNNLKCHCGYHLKLLEPYTNLLGSGSCLKCDKCHSEFHYLGDDELSHYYIYYSNYIIYGSSSKIYNEYANSNIIHPPHSYIQNKSFKYLMKNTNLFIPIQIKNDQYMVPDYFLKYINNIALV